MKIVNKKILVAGGAGFLGFHLVSELLKSNNLVVVVDNLSTGNINNINKLRKQKDFEFIEFDISNKEIIDILASFQFDIIYNLACPANPDYCFSHSLDVLNACINGTLNLIEIALKCNSRYIYFSTSEVYGDPEVLIQSESYFGNVNPVGERACYEEGKRVAETILHEYSKIYNLDIKIVRLFNTYGPNMQLYDGRVVVNFIKNALLGHDLVIYGDGNQTRSYCYVLDIIEAIIKLTNLKLKDFLVLNLGNPDEYTINETANIIKDITNSKSLIIHQEAKYEDSKKRKPSIELASRILNWHPKTTFHDGLKECINYYKDEVVNEE